MAALITNSSPYLEVIDYSNLSASEKAFIDALITAGQAYIEGKYCNRIFLQDDYTDEKHDGNGWESIFVDNPPLNSLTDIDILSTSFSGSTTTTTYTSDKFDLNEKTGEIRFKPGSFLSEAVGVFSEGFQNIQITYNGGYTSTDSQLEPVRMMIADFVIESFDPSLKDELLEREKLGDYSYSKANNYFEKLSFSKRKILNSYRIRKV